MVYSYGLFSRCHKLSHPWSKGIALWRCWTKKRAGKKVAFYMLGVGGSETPPLHDREESFLNPLPRTKSKLLVPSNDVALGNG